MLAYAANDHPAGRTGSPKALTLIITGHALVLAAVLTAKPELVRSAPNNPTDRDQHPQSIRRRRRNRGRSNQPGPFLRKRSSNDWHQSSTWIRKSPRSA